MTRLNAELERPTTPPNSRVRRLEGRRRIPNRKLQELRINAGLSPNDLAYETGVDAGSIRFAEKGHVPGPRIQLALASHFGFKPTDIWPIDRQAALR